MQGGWTIERITQIAPDPASAKAGQGLGNARKWASVGRDADATLWGECQGSGANPYQVRVDLNEPAFKCSCPSRKFPCKHALGLLLIYVAGGVAEAARPAWVEEWLASRAQRAQKKQEKAAEPPKPVDPVAQAKRRAERLGRVKEGLAATKVWVEDIVRAGIATLPSRGYAYFDEPARRLIDAQAPGAARMLHDLGSIATGGGDWHRRFLDRLAAVNLLVEAVDRLDQLPEPTAADALAAAGVPVPNEDVLATPAVADEWHVLSQEVELEDRLRVQRTWLYGARTARSAMILFFAHGTSPLDASLQPGTRFEGEVCFFPGNQLRALVKSKQQPATRAADAVDYPTLTAACTAFGDLLSRQPWLTEIVFPIRHLTPIRVDDSWHLADADRRSLPTLWSDDAAWTAVAISGGRPIDVAAAFDGHRLRPLAILADELNDYVSLQPASTPGTDA